MTSRARGVRVPPEIDEAIAREAESRGATWSATTAELLSEALKMRRAPGIVFADGPAGRRAVVAGGGLDVWEVVAAWKAGGEDEATLRADFPWLTAPQLRAALAYYELYPAEIDDRLAREERWTAERVRRELPALAPRSA